jgi:hypothetical protein
MPLISVADAATAFRRPPGTIRRWIHEDGIDGQPDPALAGRPGQRKLYPGDKLQAAYERRHPELVEIS